MSPHSRSHIHSIDGKPAGRTSASTAAHAAHEVSSAQSEQPAPAIYILRYVADAFWAMLSSRCLHVFLAAAGAQHSSSARRSPGVETTRTTQWLGRPSLPSSVWSCQETPVYSCWLRRRPVFQIGSGSCCPVVVTGLTAVQMSVCAMPLLC